MRRTSLIGGRTAASMAASWLWLTSAPSTTRAGVSVALDDLECDDGISSFRSPDGCSITMIGTAHVSELSALLVQRTIKKLQPDVVMIELDANRLGLT